MPTAQNTGEAHQRREPYGGELFVHRLAPNHPPPPGGRTDALVQTVITWRNGDKLLRTRGLDADQTEAAIKATFKMLNIIEGEVTKE